jgi:threonyl-tRNA synthetase
MSQVSFKVVSREEAIDIFTRIGENYKVEIIDSIPKDEEIKIYYHGEWFDLCRGPHLNSSGEIGKAFKLTKVAGAYWRGDSNNEMLQRIYGTAWETQEDLDSYLLRLEEAEKRDHRKLGKELDLFHFQEEGTGSCILASKRLDTFSKSY